MRPPILALPKTQKEFTSIPGVGGAGYAPIILTECCRAPWNFGLRCVRLYLGRLYKKRSGGSLRRTEVDTLSTAYLLCYQGEWRFRELAE